MRSLNSQKFELERQQRLIVKNLYRLLDELEGRPVPRRKASGFPFNLLEAAINGALRKLERAVDKLVAAAFSRVGRRR